LVFPPPDTKKETRFGVPMGLLYLATPLKQNGFEVRLLNLSLDRRFIEIPAHLLEWADLVGLSIPSYCRASAIQLVKRIKQYIPGLPVMVGGPDCILFPELFPGSDITVTGEAEGIIVDIANAVLHHSDLNSIPGLIIRGDDGTIKSTGDLYPIKELDQSGFPDRGLLSYWDERKPNLESQKTLPKSTELITSRGCPRHCRFCSRDALTYSNYRERSVENVTTELVQIADRGYEMVWVSDDNFTVNTARALKIFNILAELRLPLGLALSGWVGSAGKELFKAARAAGVRIISFGLESGNQDVLDFYQKGITLEQIKTAVNLADECGLFTVGNFIIGAPVETKEHFAKTIVLAQELPLDSVNFKVLGYMAGSSLWKEQVVKGNISPDERNVFADKRRGLGNFTLEELKQVVAKSYQGFNSNPRRHIRLKKKMLEQGLPYDLKT